ncbi:MAG: beta-agarase [Armatimonadia bacterium]|nr:beta-agarase [Armatimonadia bacterium]
MRLDIMLCGLLLGGSAMADMTLYDFEPPFDTEPIETTDVQLSTEEVDGDRWLVLETGHEAEWPGIVLPGPEGAWDLKEFDRVELDVVNTGDNRVNAMIRVDNPGADGANHCVQVGVELAPGESGTIVAPLPFMPRGPDGEPLDLFGMRGYPGAPKGFSDFDPSNTTQVLVFVPRPTEDHRFRVNDLRAVGDGAAMTVDPEEFFPLIDRFGQYIHRDWPGKTGSEEDLIEAREREAEEIAAEPRPDSWNEWGGWADGPQLDATGFFRTEKVDGKWWLVDPSGRLFISHGVDCVGGWGDNTPIDDREHWFRGLPEEGDPLAAYYGRAHARHGHYAGRSMRTFDFGAANLHRKYGEDWHGAFADRTHERLASWGINTIANWSDLQIGLMDRTPYVATIHFDGKVLEGSEGYWAQFRDVFDPSFDEALESAASWNGERTGGDPWCLGYFVDNEISWGSETALAEATLTSPATQVAKQVFIEDLRAKYGEVSELNEAWDADHASWDALLESTDVPATDAAREDLLAFNAKTAETYFRKVRDAVKSVAPDQLYLGCRFAWVNDQVARIAAEYCDVVSYNLYMRSVEDFRFPGPDVPLIIGEFHFGALDRGLFHTGLVSVESQEARAELYREYVRGMLRHPQFVGCHWFKYRDEATTGRPLDEENYQIGFVDICDRPYSETIAAVREIGRTMYEYRAGG